MKLNKLNPRSILKNRKGQGMVEYILLLVVVVAIVMAMKGKLTEYVQGTMFGDLTAKISGVMSN